MKYSLSTNWCNRRLNDGEAIADLALSMGFDELELGFNTSVEQVAGFKKRINDIPVKSIHAFCPVPLSAPQGYPELYSLATTDSDARALAFFHVRKNIEFAAEIGANSVVLHAGRVSFSSLLNRDFHSGILSDVLQKSELKKNDPEYLKLLEKAKKKRNARTVKIMSCFEKECEKLFPVLQRCNVTLALENLPFLEAFPNETEMMSLLKKHEGAPLNAWFDTGHNRVREMHGWKDEGDGALSIDDSAKGFFDGMHLNDVVDYHDDHFAPGGGAVDFVSLASLAKSVRHVVFEPHAHVSENEVRKSLSFIKSLWNK